MLDVCCIVCCDSLHLALAVLSDVVIYASEKKMGILCHFEIDQGVIHFETRLSAHIKVGRCAWQTSDATGPAFPDRIHNVFGAPAI
jgi:hypothetical protein